MSLEKSRFPRRIALVDCNNFYASCERVFNPAWEGRPVGVLSNNDGCIIARSNELKEAGIPMGAPYFKFRDRLKDMNAVIVSSNYTLYGDMSGRVMNTLSQFTPDMEVYSIDEAWLNLTGFDTGRLDAYGREIVKTAHKNTGIPVSMGIGPTKVLAKIANRICKKQKIPAQVFNIGSAESLEGVLSSFEVGDIWGIGRQWSKKLNGQGIYTALDLRNANPQYMRDCYNVVMQRIVMELRGEPCLEFEDIEPKKQIIASRSFGERVKDKASLIEAVTMHAMRAGEKLRVQKSACGVMQVAIRTGKHSPQEQFFGRSAMIRFPVATADTGKLIGAARAGVERIFKQGPRYAKAGVVLLDIVPAANVQSGLFDCGDSEKSKTLMKTVDKLNRINGRHTVFMGCHGPTNKWAMKRDLKTPAFTTRWSDLPAAK